MWIRIKNQLFIFSFCLAFFLTFQIAFCQPKSEKKELADEYVKRENFSKALPIYEGLQGDSQWDALIFNNLIKCLEKEKPNKVESVIRKFQKKYPTEFKYQEALYFHFSENRKDRDAADKYIEDRLKPWFLKTSERVKSGYQFFLEHKKLLEAENILSAGIKNFGFSLFWKEAFALQSSQKKFPELSKTIIQLLGDKLMDPAELKSYLQEPVQNENLARQLQIDLLKEIQTKPGEGVYSDFLAWVYLQVKDYDGALAQYKALDMLENSGGTRSFQLGEFAVNNEENRIAIKCFEFIIQQFPVSQYRFLAQQKMVQLRENLVKNTYPIQKEEVRKLIDDYQLLSQNQFLNYYELIIKVSELYGKYLNKPDSAILILETGFNARAWPATFKNRAKILLADMYILKDEPWEASLLYGQVEKDEVETLIGYEAKLKNAKVFYFKGEFELCEEQLDVLKMSTSRDISNDAIELSLLIQDILAEDTTGYFLGKFADIDLLTFQGNFQASIEEIEKLIATVSNRVVLERLKFRLFRNFQATRQFPKALEMLDQIFTTKASDLYLDDALYFSGIIHSESFKDKEKAQALFLQLIKEIPGSVYVADARKRLRILRGDGIN
jgi:outer membrane protein assembly factor BamD (BamD/ComL family)